MFLLNTDLHAVTKFIGFYNKLYCNILGYFIFECFYAYSCILESLENKIVIFIHSSLNLVPFN